LLEKAVQFEATNAIYAQAAAYLREVRRQGKSEIYGSPEAFALFVRGGGNVALYERTSAAQRRIYQQYDSLSLLDVGVGDGRALVPALTDNIGPLDILEPSQPLLSRARDALSARGVDHRPIQAKVQHLMENTSSNWDVVQATYSLQSIPYRERPALFNWLRRHAGRVLIAEFDAPEFTDLYEADRVRHVVKRFERGLAEYPDSDQTVARGFLMPMLFSSFDPSAPRANHENPIEHWVRLLRDCSFASIRTEFLCEYWWAPAYVLDAR